MDQINPQIQRENPRQAQKQLKEKILQMIESYPHPGIYRDEISIQKWKEFIKSFLSVLQKQEGDRGLLAQVIQQELLCIDPQITELFKELNIPLTSKHHIKFIATFFDTYKPSDLYSKWEKSKISLYQSEESLDQLLTNQSMKETIINGLKRKYTQQESDQKYCDILVKAQIKRQQLKSQTDDLYLDLTNSENYKKYWALMQLLEPLIKKWNQCDSKIGADNTSRGSKFEDLCKTVGIDLVLENINLTRDQCQVFQNLNWNPGKGECDFAIFDLNFQIKALVECKCRFFDISEGFRQSGTQGRVLMQKQNLMWKDGLLPIELDSPCFVLTTLPEHQYFLGFESSLKQDLNKITSKQSLEDILIYDFDKLFDELIPRYSQFMSPQTCLKTYGDEFIIIIQ